jgi:hypothetical protein
VFSVGAAPSLYNEDFKRAEEMRESLEMAVEVDGKKVIRL